MEIDLAQLDSSAARSDLLRTDICIVGGGIAGLILAQELAALGHDVLLLEAGGGELSATSQSGDVVQAGKRHPGTTEPRVSALGGSSLVWGGQLLPLPVDADWPIAASDLEAFLSPSEHLLGVDHLPYNAPEFFQAVNEKNPAALTNMSGIAPALSKFAPFSHRNLGRTMGATLRSHNQISVALRARAVELLPAASRDRIEAVRVRSASGRDHRIVAQRFVLAAGTVETVRLLLASCALTPAGVGNAHDQVGRNFHDHLTVTAATLTGGARQSLLSLRPWIRKRTVHAMKLSADTTLRRQLQINPVLAHFGIDEPATSGVAALRNILRARQQGTAAHSIRATLPELPRTLRDAAFIAASAATLHRRYVSPAAVVQLRLNVAQQAPSPSRVTLSSELTPVLDWRIDAGELATLRRFANHLRNFLNHEGTEWAPWVSHADSEAPIADLDDARHSMGGACMGVDEHYSVVNTDLRVHGLQNLFIASAAVFPTGAPQLPTLPLMQLALRLAQHLHRQD